MVKGRNQQHHINIVEAGKDNRQIQSYLVTFYIDLTKRITEVISVILFV